MWSVLWNTMNIIRDIFLCIWIHNACRILKVYEEISGAHQGLYLIISLEVMEKLFTLFNWVDLSKVACM